MLLLEHSRPGSRRQEAEHRAPPWPAIHLPSPAYTSGHRTPIRQVFLSTGKKEGQLFCKEMKWIV